MPKFKVGDRVTIVKAHRFVILIGSTGTVVATFPLANLAVINFSKPVGRYTEVTFDFDSLEHEKIEMKTPDAYKDLSL